MESGRDRGGEEIVGKRIINGTIHYLLKSQPFNWLPSSLFSRKMIEDYERENSIEEDTPPLWFNARQGTILNYGDVNRQYAEHKYNFGAPPLNEPIFKAKIIDRRILNQKVQFLLKSERLSWLDKYLCDKKKIEEFEKQFESDEAAIFASLESSKDPSVLFESEWKLPNIIIYENKGDFETPIIGSKIIRKRFTGGSIQYLLYIQAYTWLSRQYFSDDMICDYYELKSNEKASPKTEKKKRHPRKSRRALFNDGASSSNTSPN